MKAFNQYLYKKEFVKKNQFINNKIKALNKKKILKDKKKKLNLRHFNRVNNNLKLQKRNKINETTKGVPNKKKTHNNSFKSTSQKIINKLYNDKFKIEKSNNNLYFNNREILDYYELNNLEYPQAKKNDNRNFLQIYWSLLKREHSFIFTFITKDDYNIKTIKYSRFIFLLCTDMAMNVFFFSDETMHKMFLDYGKYNFIQQIPQIIYSTLITKILELLLCFLSMTDNYYYKIKKDKNINKKLIIVIKKRINIKIKFFYIFTILMLSFYWYLISCFCAVYRNTQIAFIKDSLLSFIFDNLIPFIIYLLPSLFRIVALKNDIKCMYQLSNIIPFF